MAIIANNHVSVSLADQDAKTMLGNYLQSSPMPARRSVDDLHVTILFSEAPISNFNLRSDGIYSAFITGAALWVDPYKQITDLVVTLDSPDLVLRRQTILAELGQSPDWNYEPHLTLAYDMPPRNESYRWWVNEVLNAFNSRYKGQLIRLNNESLSSTVVDQPAAS